MSAIVTGAIIGGIVGIVVAMFVYAAKDNRYKKLLAAVKEPHEYAALYHYASFTRYKNSLKFFDSYGLLYVIDKTAFYKVKSDEPPAESFYLPDCTIQAEPDWRMMKWFSITTPAGQKFYFNSHKMGAFKNNSEETLKGLAVLKSKQQV